MTGYDHRHSHISPRVMTPKDWPVNVVEAVQTELDALGEPARSSALAASALALAERLDAANSARDIAAVAHELRDTLAEIEKRYPRQQQEDEVDRLRRERARRLAR